MAKEVSDKVESKGVTRITFPSQCEPLPQYDKRTDLERSLGDVINRLATKGGI